MSAAEGGEGAADRPPGRQAEGSGGRRFALVARHWRRPAMPTREGVADWLRRQADAETQARTGFFLAPAGMMAGIWLCYGLGVRPEFWLVLPVAAALLAFAFGLRGTPVAGPLWLLAGCVAAGLALCAAELSRTRTTIFSGEATVRIEGTVAWRDRDERGRLRYLVDIARTDRPVLSRPPERAQILVSSRHDPIPIGGLYKGLVRLRAPSGPALPGGYDFAFGSHFRGLGAHGFGLGAPEAQDADPAAPNFRHWLLKLRLTASERIRETIGGPEGAVASALITGDRAGIPDDVNLWLRTTGLSHVLSISGLHMALVAGFAMAAVRALLAAIPWCALVLPIKKIAAVGALTVATFYLLISGSNVATDRSYIMLAIMLLAVLVDRPALTLRNVAIAAIVVLVMTPHAMMTASFQMSFAATAALLAAYGAYARATAGRGSDDPPRGRLLQAVLLFAGLGASSLIAGLATGPYAAYHFQRLAPFGLFANMLALPLFSFWIMPLALISMVLMPFGLDGLPLVLMGHGLSLVFAIARSLHELMPDAPTGLMTPASLLVLSIALMLACFLTSGLRWIALPIAIGGLAVAADRSDRPELLIFEDGKEVALIDQAGKLVPLRNRPNDFVFAQWTRAFPSRENADVQESPPVGFACEPVDATAGSGPATADGAENASPPASSAGAKAPRKSTICRATTRRGLKVVWTDDYRQTGTACDTADIAVVARAIRLEACRSGAILVTLRSLRRTGSLAVARSVETGRALVTQAIDAPPNEWNRHRLAPWPEFWRKPPETASAAPPSPPHPARVGREGE